MDENANIGGLSFLDESSRSRLIDEEFKGTDSRSSTFSINSSDMRSSHQPRLSLQSFS